MNILVACFFDLIFTNVLLGWKGSVVDLRILDNALHERDKFIVLEDNIYYSYV